MAEAIIRGGLVVTETAVQAADVRITGEIIEAVGPDLHGGGEEIDARGLHVFPGLIDVHVHFNEPGRTEWEGAASGSRALAAGGGTLFFDMPLNSTPCVVNVREAVAKREALEAASITDFALWGGLVPGSVREMEEMAHCGVVGFKAFLCDSGLPEFARADDLTLYEGLHEAARLNLPVAVHAESHEITSALARRCMEQGRTEVRDFLASRPVIAEVEAIQRAALLAAEIGAKLHIVHVSSGRGVAVAAEARTRGCDVSIETCPHYLSFTEEDIERLGAAAKCAPPLRDSQVQASLWQHVLNGTVDIVGSDHSPAPPEMKCGDFWRAWGGIAGVQSTLAVLLERGYRQRGLPLKRIVSLIAGEPARRFGIRSKGAIEAGKDADLVLVDLSQTRTLTREALLQRHAISPYLGESFHATVKRTICRGETIYADGRITAQSHGRLVRPERN